MTIWKGATATRRWRRMRPDPAAGLGDLEAALTCEGCPVCTRAAGADQRWLDHFLYEGYQEPEVMQAVARGGGFCGYHARRLEAFGLSATVALIYLALIHECLPRLADRVQHRKRAIPLIAMPDFCEACTQAHEVERRECFFLALLLNARRGDRYGSPAVVCMPHLLPLAKYLDDAGLRNVVAVQSRTAAALDASLADGSAPWRTAADRSIRVVLGPPGRPETARLDGEGFAFGDDPDPVGRMRRRLRHLDSCAICAEIADSRAQWLRWLARAAETAGDLTDVLPLCRDHVWQARSAGGPALASALAAVVVREAGERLAYARKDLDARLRAGFTQAIRRAWSGLASRKAVLESLRRGRECPLCRHARDSGNRALLLLTALLESVDGRRAFENGYGLCVRHAALALALPETSGVADIVASTMHARFAVLRWEIEEQLRRGAWQARPQRRGAESGAWLKAGSRFAGAVPVAGQGG